jgi:hypothetical protein
MTTCTCTVACSYACEELGIQYKRTVVGCAKRTRPRIAWHGARGYSIHRVPGMHVPCPDQPLDRPACVYCIRACASELSPVYFLCAQEITKYNNFGLCIAAIEFLLSKYFNGNINYRCSVNFSTRPAGAAMSPLLTRLCHPCRLSVLAAP